MADEVPPIDLDLADIDPGQLARLLVSRSLDNPTDLHWAEIGWDISRYPQRTELTVTLLGMVETLLKVEAQRTGLTAAQLWQHLMLAEQA